MGPTGGRRDLLVYLPTIGLSAFLMFSVELLSGRLVLPAFGGSPAVWTTTLCFFTAMVFVGYLYAHLLSTRLSWRTGAAVHLVVVTIAFGLTLASPQDVGRLRVEAWPDAANVLAALVVLVGPLAFVLSTTSPLLSSWYGRTGRDAWWLYAVSNAASLTGLLAYPFLIEPSIALSTQRTLLVAGFAAYAVVLACTTVAARRTPDWSSLSAGPETPGAAMPQPGRAPDPGAVAPTRRRVLRWLVAAMVPAGLLSATTTFLATDLVSAPLLWIGPLGLYLASMTIAFSARGRPLVRAAEFLMPTAAALLWIPWVLPAGWPIAPLVLMELGAFGVLATAIHGRLARDRPDERYLTLFYLVLAAGGMLATGFVALAAPLLFATVLEYPILVVAGTVIFALLPRQVDVRKGRGPRAVLRGVGQGLVPYAVTAGLLFVLVLAGGAGPAVNLIAILLLVGAAIVAVARSDATLAIATGAVVVIFTFLASTHPLVRERSFFGVTEVRLANDGVGHLLFSGTTLHGAQFSDDRRHDPTTYYVAAGPVGEAFADLRARVGRAASIGVVGLGTGTVAAFGRPGDHITFYEIDQAVISIATDPASFTFLADTPAQASIVKGDARIMLGDVPTRPSTCSCSTRSARTRCRSTS